MYLHGEDRLFWPEGAPGEAFYIPSPRGRAQIRRRGFAQAMLRWAEDEVRAKGRVYLRLDCEPRAKLLALYRSAGFAPVDPMPSKWATLRGAVHEKPVLPSRS